MSSLTHIQKKKLERELGMEGGYVLDFNNRTFEEFFREVVGVQINSPQYNRGSGSKANRLRAFWDIATKEQLKNFVLGIREGWDTYTKNPLNASTEILFQEIIDDIGCGNSKVKQRTKQTAQTIKDDISAALHSQLLSLSSLPPQQRGYDFEKFLKKLFDAYGLSARASFRLIGEQIDGSFEVHNETYLLEAKWQNLPIGADDLHVFEGKLTQKASWTRGLFVSISGFSEEGLVAFGRGKRVVCMDGLDLSELLSRKLSVIDVLAAKVRRAAETGHPFVRIRELM